LSALSEKGSVLCPLINTIMILKYGNAKIVQASTALVNLMPPSVGMVKRAGKKMADLDYDPTNYVYLRNRAISSLELHGPNQNWDAFEDAELQAKYATFIGCPISVDHIGTTKIGTVLDSEYIKLSDFRYELGIPLLPVKDTIAVLGEKCRKETTFNEVLRYATANKLVRGSDRQLLLDSVGTHLCLGGWVENIWAVDKQAAEDHTRGLVNAMLKEAVTDSSMGTLVNESVCSVCGHIATGELPPHEDFCDDIRLHKGALITVGGHQVTPYEINRDIEFFEDSLILPHSLGGKAGGEGADMDAKLLEVFSHKKQGTRKKAYVGLVNPKSPSTTQFQPDVYVMIGEMPEVVEKHRDEFNEQREEFADEAKGEDIDPSDYPEGTIISILFEDGDVDAIVIEETDSGVTVAIDGIDDPVEVPYDDINEVLEYPEDLDQEDIIDIENPEMHPEKRAASKN
jgi:hypothetical protein